MKTSESETVSLTFVGHFNFSLGRTGESRAVHQVFLLNKVEVKGQELMSSILFLPPPIRRANMNHFVFLCVKRLCMVSKKAELIQWELLNLECRQAEVQQRSL